jgi:glycosyltransferase involved in cell wall biosynthesis
VTENLAGPRTKLASLGKRRAEQVARRLLKRFPQISMVFGRRRKRAGSRVLDISPHPPVSSPRRALVSYITWPLLYPERAKGSFSNPGIARTMVEVLNELGYIVDLIDYDDTSFAPSRPYDLFIGHGGVNFEPIARSDELRSAAVIYFSTGTYWKVGNESEQTRLDALQRRRNVSLPPERRIEHSEEWANRRADAIVCLGGREVRRTYQDFPAVFNLDNAAYTDPNFDLSTKNFELGRRAFLFFAGPGNVHKGLDLLLESFSGIEEELYICQEIGKEFRRVYRRELALPNVHEEGFVSVGSPRFRELISKCNSVIFPSSGEGSPGSVIECMHRGLIPIVSKESNLEIDQVGFILQNSSVAEIRTAVKHVANESPDWHESACRAVQAHAQKFFTEEVFHTNLKEAILKSLEKADRRTRSHPEPGMSPSARDETKTSNERDFSQRSGGL